MQTPPPSAPNHRSPQREREHSSTDQRGARRFRNLLDDAALPQMPPPAWLPCPPLDDTRQEAPPPAQASRLTSPAGTSPQPMPIRPATPDEQTLALRASTGPLAGLLLQAEWRGGRLSLRLSTPESTLTARLAREREALGSALSAALGVEVIVEVGHAR